MLTDRVVKTCEGTLVGEIQQTHNGTKYSSFQGIPYAEPPVGDLRFEPPLSKKPWTDEKYVKNLGPAPYGGDIFSGDLEPNTSEDCLYLNVYSPHTGDYNGVFHPVIVWIYGGSFNLGSSNTNIYGPDYFMEFGGTMVVTFNYRLGALGFLSLQNEKCPGNNGLKDQVMALKWVKRNIKYFGGDPDRVTIFGESAGAAAVQYLMLSPLTKGLFHGAISASGSVLSPWAYMPSPVDAAFLLGKLLGCTTLDPKTDKDKLLKFLKEQDPKKFLECNKDISAIVKGHEAHMKYPFSPVVEPKVEGAFLSETPQEIIRKGEIHDVPYILGLNMVDGMAVLDGPPKACPFRSEEDWEQLIPSDLDVERRSEKSSEVTKKIKEFYFPNGWDDSNYYRLLTVTYFALPNDTILRSVANIRGRKSNLYLYHFTYEGTLGKLVKKGFNFPDIEGTVHAEDLVYYWRPADPSFRGYLKNTTDLDEGMIKTFMRLWSGFARDQKPIDDIQIWRPYLEYISLYREINGFNLQPEMQQGLMERDIYFWRDLYAVYSKKNPHKV